MTKIMAAQLDGMAPGQADHRLTPKDMALDIGVPCTRRRRSTTRKSGAL